MSKKHLLLVDDTQVLLLSKGMLALRELALRKQKNDPNNPVGEFVFQASDIMHDLLTHKDLRAYDDDDEQYAINDLITSLQHAMGSDANGKND